MDEKTPTTIRRTAMDMLARRDHSLHELRSKLARRFSSATDLIADEVDKLKQEGLVWPRPQVQMDIVLKVL